MYLSIFNVFHYVSFNQTYLIDFFFKENINDSVLNWYNLLWINNWYLNFLIVILISFNFIKNEKLLLTVFFLLLFFLIEYQDFFLNNFKYYRFSFLSKNFNFFLINFLNKYHPPFFFITLSVIFFLLCSLSNLILFSNIVFNFKLFNFSFTNKISILFYPSLIALILGSWWAQQEDSWGGWWNWDSSEMLSIFFFFVFYYFFHKINKNVALVSDYLRIYLQVISMSVYYFLVQIGFNVTSHNFGLKFFYFFFNTFFFIKLVSLAVIFFLLVLLLFFKSASFFLNPHSWYCYQNNLNYKYFYSIIVLVSLFYILNVTLIDVYSSFTDNLFFNNTYTNLLVYYYVPLFFASIVFNFYCCNYFFFNYFFFNYLI